MINYAGLIRIRGIKVQMAAIFCAGLLWGQGLYMYSSDVPREAAEKVKRWEELAKSFGLSLPAVALAFAYLPACVDRIAVGCASAEQVCSNVQLCNADVPRELWQRAKAEQLSAGCILMELYTGEMLFGTHENMEHLALVEQILAPLPSAMIRRTPHRDHVNNSPMFKKLRISKEESRWVLNWPARAGHAMLGLRGPACYRLAPQLHRRAAGFATGARPSLTEQGQKYFTKTHEWFQVEEEGVGTVGITQVAQRALGEVLYCKLPKEGARFKVMETLATLEALKSVGEVHSPIRGEVIEVNSRLEREPALVTYAPLTDGWLVRMAFDGQIPRYLRRSSAIPRSQIEPLLADIPGLMRYLEERLLSSPGDSDALQELTFDGLRTMERWYIHKAATELNLYTQSHGTGAGRQLVVRRAPRTQNQPGPDADEDSDDEEEDEEEQVAGASSDASIQKVARSRCLFRVLDLEDV
eukprot:s2899_g21.t2